METVQEPGLKAFLLKEFNRNPAWWSTGMVSVITLILVRKLILAYKIKSKLPPGPWPLPIIGNMHLLGDSPHHNLWRLAQKHGPLMSLRLGAIPLVVVSSAEAAREFLKVQDKAWAGRPPSISRKAFVNMRDIVWGQYGAHWRHLRKICTLELFTHKRLESFRSSRTEEFDQVVSSIHQDCTQGQTVLMNVKLGHLATNNMTRMLLNKRFFGTDTAGQMEAQRFKELNFSMFKVLSTVIVGDFIPWLKWVTYASGFVAYMKRLKVESDAFYQEFLEVKKVAANNANAGNEKYHAQEDFVDVLLAQPSEDGTGRLDDESIKVVIQDMLLAGSDTSSNALEWGLAELICHPECMNKLQAELDNVVGKYRAVSEKDIPNLPYLHAVVKEVFRLHPVTPLGIPHESIEPTNVWGFELPAKTQLFINIYAIHRDPKWWVNPLQFDPDRFIKSPEIDMRGNHYQFLPFGAGRRQCPGIELGILFVQFGIARLVHAFEFTLPDGQDPSTLDVTEKFGITMPMANPLRVIAKQRLGAHLY